MCGFGVVVIGYNRPKSIERLLIRLAECDYGDDEVTLIVSLDNSGSDECEKVAKAFCWKYGEKIVITHEKRMGLKEHIIFCGDLLLSDKYEALAYFEDDIYPSKLFYKYMKIACRTYADTKQIAGFSFYSASFMTSTEFCFEPQKSLYDVYFLQVAQSWGQAWTPQQWRCFKEWYKENANAWSFSEKLPSQIGQWGEKSWLKFFMKYCAEKEMYFVYPYVSLSTCYSEVGEHTVETSTMLQQGLLVGDNDSFRMPEFSNKVIRYDAFYENENIKTVIGERHNIPEEEITVDIYGTKTVHKRYWLTNRKVNYKEVGSFALAMKPHEMNVMLSIPGEQIKLYDTSEEVEVKKVKKEKVLQLYEYYNVLRITKKNAIVLCWNVWERSLRRFINSKKR